MSKQFDCSKHLRMIFPSRNKGINRLHLGMTIQFASSSSIKNLDEKLIFELSSLSLVCSIEDRALGFCHVGHEE